MRAEIDAALTELVNGLKLEPASGAAKELLRAIDAGYDDALKEATSAQAHVQQLERAFERRREIEEEIVERRQRLALYRFLAQQLRATNFIDFVIAEGIRHLAISASIELKTISRGRYSLQSLGSDFVVMDHHNADETRSVATLSGGESFLASLSLALALSKGIVELSGDATRAKLEAIFIDEGFGSLDPETLDIVIDSLEHLQADERMIGVITHVPVLAERLPRVLQVESSPASAEVRLR